MKPTVRNLRNQNQIELHNKIQNVVAVENDNQLYAHLKLGNNGNEWQITILLRFIFNFTAALKKYRDLNGGLPDRIIVYRDGVGDGQLKTVVNHEVPQLKASFKDLPIDYS